MQDIFKFWSQIDSSFFKKDKLIHPEDGDAFHRMCDNYSFNLQSLPSNFTGSLKTAKVVLLYLSPGFGDADLEEAKNLDSQTRYLESLKGTQPLKSEAENAGAYKWWKSRTNIFDLKEDAIRNNFAILNIGAYHSVTFDDKGVLSCLPSSRAALDWAQKVLFKEAEEGKRIVICLRSHAFWGLIPGKKYGKSLFSPEVTRGGHMLKGALRDEIVKAVQNANLN